MMRAMIAGLMAVAAMTACTKKEEVQVPPAETTIVTPAPVVVTPEPAAPAPADTTTVVTPAEPVKADK